jgi:hypothetical protein
MITTLLTSMKKGTLMCMTVASIASIGPNLFAQNGKNAVQIGTIKSLSQHFLDEQSTAARGNMTIQTSESTLPLVINLHTAEGFGGGISGIPNSNVFFDFTNNKVTGKVILPSEKKAYTYYSDANGNVFVEKTDINKLVCVDMFKGPMEPAAESNTQRAFADPIPELESLPGEVAVIYLDFDGQVVTSPKWNSGKTITAEPANLSTSQMTNTWLVVSEDYRPYKVNVTTKESVYNAAPVKKRMRCVITPTNTAAPGSGGVAYIGSFSVGDDKTPCWVYNLGGNGQTTGETCSHEVGHTMGLSHDGTNSGTEYYAGNNGWAPIMGVSYGKTVTQWSKGEYTDANEPEDDVNIIGTQNGFTFRADEAGNTIGAAAALKIESDNKNVLAAKNYGVILQASDIDVYSFKTGAGSITLNVNPAANFPDLNVLLTITNASGTVLATANPTDKLSASITTNIATSGTYYLHVDGTGNGTATAGYTDYSSIGEYTIDGSVVAVTTGIAESGKNNASLYPNPATENIMVSLNNPGIVNTISIVNMLGQAIYTIQTEQQSLSINLSEYNKGIYFMTVHNAMGTSTTKFIKE